MRTQQAPRMGYPSELGSFHFWPLGFPHALLSEEGVGSRVGVKNSTPSTVFLRCKPTLPASLFVTESTQNHVSAKGGQGAFLANEISSSLFGGALKNVSSVLIKKGGGAETAEWPLAFVRSPCQACGEGTCNREIAAELREGGGTLWGRPAAPASTPDLGVRDEVS